jgi:hypothetical protein
MTMSLADTLSKKYEVKKCDLYSNKIIAHYVKADLFAREADAGLKEVLKEFMKKAIVPALMTLGPVACGTQPESDATTHKAEKQASVQLAEQDIDCDIEIDGDTVKWSFTDAKGDTLTLEHPLEIDDLGRNTLEITKEPKGERMQTFKEAALDTFSFGFDHMQKKYGCNVEHKDSKLPATSPDLP